MKDLQLNGSLLRLAWGRYLMALDRRPLATKIATGALLSALGELLGQVLSKQKTTLKERLHRILALGGYGAVWSGPSMHFFQRWLESLPLPGGVGGVLARTLIDQLLYGPACTVAFLSWMHKVVLKLPLTGVLPYLYRNFRRIQLTSYRVWPFASLLCYLLPENLRLLFMSSVSVGYTAVLILMTGAGNKKGALTGPKLTSETVVAPSHALSAADAAPSSSTRGIGRDPEAALGHEAPLVALASTSSRVVVLRNGSGALDESNVSLSTLAARLEGAEGDLGTGTAPLSEKHGSVVVVRGNRHHRNGASR